MDGGAKDKTQYSIGYIDGGFCNWTDRVLEHSRKPRYFSGYNFGAGTSGRAWHHRVWGRAFGGRAFPIGVHFCSNFRRLSRVSGQLFLRLLFLKGAYFTYFSGVKFISFFSVPKFFHFVLTGIRQPAIANLSVFRKKIDTCHAVKKEQENPRPRAARP